MERLLFVEEPLVIVGEHRSLPGPPNDLPMSCGECRLEAQRGPCCQTPMTLPAGSRNVATHRSPSGYGDVTICRDPFQNGVDAMDVDAGQDAGLS
jgi:hypothetical protein